MFALSISILFLIAIISSRAELQRVVTDCIAHDNRAKRQLYDHLSGKIMAICQRYFKNNYQADDVFQECFIRLFDKLHTFNPEKGELEGWAYRLSVNVALKTIQSEKMQSTDDIDEVYDPSVGTVEMNDNLTMEELKSFIGQLPEKQQLVFNLYVIDGYNHQEIAEQLDISEGTSKSQLSRAKEFLRKKHEEYNRINEPSDGKY